MLTQLEHASFEMQLRNEFLRRDGTAFQELFAQIMERSHPADFMRVAPWGKKGDLKCDGYLPSARSLFQCYAPRELKEPETKRKINTDFSGAVHHWKPHFDQWVLVHNVIEGTPSWAAQLLLAMGRKHTPLLLNAWGFGELRERLLQLPLRDITDIIGPPMSEAALASVQIADLVPVIETVADGPTLPVTAVAPVPAGKIEANHLSGDIEFLLQAGMSRAPLVERYFAHHHDPTLGDRVGGSLKSHYVALRDRGLAAAHIFEELDALAGGRTVRTAKQRVAIYAILAYFFEQCDIFEAPRASPAP